MDYIKELVGAYLIDAGELTGDPLEDAKKIYKAIKEDEKTRQTWCDKNEQPELFWAKYDLRRLKEDYTGLTKNQLYLKHQSVMINNIYLVLKVAKQLNEGTLEV